MDEKNCTGSQRSEKNSESPAQSFEDLSLNLDHQLSPSSSNPDPDPAFSDSCDDECYDAVLLYCEEDMPKAQEIVDEMNKKIKMKDGINAKVEMFEMANTEIKMFGKLTKILETCSYIFVLCTNNFKKDMMTQYLTDESIMSILSKNHHSYENPPWKVVPLVIQSENIEDLPFGLNSLHRIKWGNNHALRNVSKILGEGAKRHVVRSQSQSLKMSQLGIQETSIQEGNNDSSNSSSLSHGDLTSGIPIKHEDPYSMTTSPSPSIKKSSGEFESQINTPVSSDSISAESVPFFTRPLEGRQPADGGEDKIFAESAPSFTKPLEGNEPTDGGLDRIFAESAPSFAKPSEGNQPADGGQESISPESVPSSIRPLEQTQPATGGQENIPASSLPSFTKPSEENQPPDGGQDCISTSSVQVTETSLEEDSSTSTDSTELSVGKKSSSDSGLGSISARLSSSPSEESSVDHSKEDTKKRTCMIL